MSGDAVRSLYDLLLYWAAALLSVLIGTPLRCPPLLLYLVFGAILGNFEVVAGDEAIDFFAEWAITIVFFALGFEETVEHFLHGMGKAWGIALIGALVPFGCGYLSAIIFWPDHGWYVHLTLATAVTATAVSLTMMVIQSLGMLKSRAAMGIMTSAVLDDVGCLVLVSILIPIVVQAKAAAEADAGGAIGRPQFTHTVSLDSSDNITGSLKFGGSAFVPFDVNSSMRQQLFVAMQADIANATDVPSYLVDVSPVIGASGMNATFHIYSSHTLGISRSDVELAIPASGQWLWQTSSLVRNSFTLRSVTLYVNEHHGRSFQLQGGGAPADAHGSADGHAAAPVEGLTAWGIIWIIIKVIIFFIIVAFLHNVVLPHDIKTGPISYIPIVRSYGIKHLLRLFHGEQVPLMVVTFGLGLGMVGAALGFHPAIGAYFAGLILEERYFELDPPAPEEKKDQTPQNSPVNDEGGATPQPSEISRRMTNANRSDRSRGPRSPGAASSINLEGFEMIDELEDPEPINTMLRAREAVGSASFLWLGPVFFVHLGAGLEIDANLLATAIPQALGIFGILWVGQFISATLSARYVPGGFSWQESIIIGFGMLGRAELYFVVLNSAKKEGVILNEIFFPMAVAALLMNISLPISMTIYRPFFRKHHPTDDEVAADGDDTRSVFTAATGRSVIARRGIGLGGVEIDECGSVSRMSTISRSRVGSRMVSRTGSRKTSRQPSKLQRRGNEPIDWAVFDEPIPAEYLAEGEREGQANRSTTTPHPAPAAQAMTSPSQ